MDCNPPRSLSMGYPREEYWSGLPFPTRGDRGVKPASLGPPALAPVPPGKISLYDSI